MSARKYAWEEWFAEPRITLVRGIHYQCSQSTMAQTVRNNASLRGLRVRIYDHGSSLVVEVTGETNKASDPTHEVATTEVVTSSAVATTEVGGAISHPDPAPLFS